MASHTWLLELACFCFFNLTLYLCVYGREITLECNPENDHKNFSSHDAYGVIYSVSEEKLKSTGMDASIICTTTNFDVNMELLVHGEPPRALQLVLSDDTLLQLYNSTIICYIPDIRDFSGIINRAPHFEEEKYYKNMTGAFKYKCGDGLTIKLEGLELLTKDFSKQNLGRFKRKSRSKCVKIGKKAGNGLKKLGNPCDCTSKPCRYMYNSRRKLVCSKCCKNHYWSKTHKNCEKCANCATTENSNIFTKCFYAECKSEHSTQQTPASTTTSKKDVVQNNEFVTTSEKYVPTIHKKKNEPTTATVESIPASTVTPMQTEVTIKPDTSTTGNAGKPVESDPNHLIYSILGTFGGTVILIVLFIYFHHKYEAAPSSPDASPPDASSPDASPPDASSPDASSPDASPPDASSPDATSPDL